MYVRFQPTWTMMGDILFKKLKKNEYLIKNQIIGIKKNN